MKKLSDMLPLGQIDTALVYFQRQTVLFEELHAANPKSAQLWFGLGVSYYKLGALYAEIDSTGQAIGYYEQAAQVFKALYEATGLDSYWGNYQTVQRQLEKLMKSGGDLTRRLDRLEKQREAASSPAERVQYQKAIVELLQPLADADPGDETIGAYLGGQYGSLAWYYLFNKEFAAAEQAARQGIALGGTETEWVHTNLALALLYQGEYEAAQAIYAAYKGKMLDEKRAWVEIFLADLDALEAEGITHPDVARVRAFLGE